TVQIAAAGVAVDEELWRIGGVEYQVTAATLLAAGEAELTPGATVAVNSYTGPGGIQIATSIRPSAANRYLYLPAVGR
ncbi:MAG TPA: hypothetical protein VNK95_06085, partial [Caldilineaceae bacterium]|nr:hypothetical protein [Caldilineaceae bacterium]